MVDPMSDDEARLTATKIAGASLEDGLRVQYWLTLVLAAAAVVTAPIVTVYSAFYHFVRYEVTTSAWGQFGVAMLYAWSFFLITTFVHWRVRTVARRAGMKTKI